MKKYYLNDFGGYQDEKAEISKIISFMRNYDEYIANGAFLQKGLFLYGKPGTGKTMLANILASESNVPLVTISNEPGDLVDKINEAFDEAISKAPCILLFDEIDELINTSKYEKSDRDNDVMRTFLSRIDGIEKTSGVLVVATSNIEQIKIIDPALIRPGRIERHMKLDLPNEVERKDILRLYLSKSKIFDNVNVDTLAYRTAGLSASGIKSLVNNVLIGALANKETNVNADYFYNYIQQIQMSGINKSTDGCDLSPIAYHEIGHFICDYILNDNIGTISIKSFGDAAGNYNKGDNDVYSKNYDYCLNQAIVALGGLAATEVFMGQKHLGAISDLAYAREMYITMSFSGLFGFDNLQNSTTPNKYANTTTERYCLQEARFLNECYDKAKSIISNNADFINVIHKLLVESKIIYESELKQIVDDNKALIKY